MVDGKLMALPEPSFVDGPNLLWLRKDWMDELGLEEPETVEDAIEIIRAFVEKDPGGNGEGNTIGLVCHGDLTERADIIMSFSWILFSPLLMRSPSSGCAMRRGMWPMAPYSRRRRRHWDI